jgi:hypothetical protein
LPFGFALHPLGLACIALHARPVLWRVAVPLQGELTNG